MGTTPSAGRRRVHAGSLLDSGALPANDGPPMMVVEGLRAKAAASVVWARRPEGGQGDDHDDDGLVGAGLVALFVIWQRCRSRRRIVAERVS